MDKIYVGNGKEKTFSGGGSIISVTLDLDQLPLFMLKLVKKSDQRKSYFFRVKDHLTPYIVSVTM